MEKRTDVPYWMGASGSLIFIASLIGLIAVNHRKQAFGGRSYCSQRELADLWGVQIFRSPFESDYWCQVPDSIKAAELASQLGIIFGLGLLVTGIIMHRRAKSTWISHNKSQGDERITGDVQAKMKTPSGVATQLRELESLRQEGILTQSEFDAQKKRLLDSN
jgi:hypothetical protein